MTEWNPDPRPGQKIVALKRLWSDGVEEEISITDCHSVTVVNQSGNVLLAVVNGKPLDSGQGWKAEVASHRDAEGEAIEKEVSGIIEIPEGWQEFYREPDGRAVKERWGTVNIRFPHPHLDFSECIVEFLPTFLAPGTPVGIILIKPKEPK